LVWGNFWEFLFKDEMRLNEVVGARVTVGGMRAALYMRAVYILQEATLSIEQKLILRN